MKITIEISEVDPVRANSHPHGFTAASSQMILPDDLKDVNMTMESVAEDVKKTVMNFLSILVSTYIDFLQAVPRYQISILGMESPPKAIPFTVE